MLLLTVLASLVTGMTAFSAVNPSIQFSNFVKSSAPTILSSIKHASFSLSTKQTKPHITPLLNVFLSARTNSLNGKPSPAVKSTLSVARRRYVHPIAPMVDIDNRNKSPNNELYAEYIEAAPRNPMQNLAHDYDEPEDLKNLPMNNNIQEIKQRYKSNNKMLSDIKKKLQQANDDYLDKQSETKVERRPKHVMGYKLGEQIEDLNNKDRYTLALNMTHNNNVKKDKNSSKRIILEAISNFRRSGVSTPSQNEIKPHKKHKVHKRRKQSGNSSLIKHRHRPKLRARDVKRRQEVGLKVYDDVVTNALPITGSAESTPTKDVFIQVMTSPSTLGPNSHITAFTLPSIGAQSTLYGFPTSSSTAKATPIPIFWKPTETLGISAPSVMFRFNRKKPDNKDPGIKDLAVATTGPSLTTLSAFEIKSEQKQKKLERFVKFINKNRVLLREFIADKKSKKANAREGSAFLRDGREREKSHVVQQLDMSPGKGSKFDALRLKGRLCQRNLMIPEGPKYNSMGCTYMPEFKKEKGKPDYPSTKNKKFLIPACCNCCKKSVLGCE